jgi:cytochrome c
MQLKFIKKWDLRIFVMAVLFVTAACNHNRNNPGYAYMGKYDMYYAKAYEAYTPNTVFADSTTMQIPVAGTIPRDYMPYPYKAKSYDDQKLAGKKLVNPVAVTNKSLETGKTQYAIYCMNCHGSGGTGDGHLFVDSLFMAKPAVLTDTVVQNKSDGELFHIITVGSLSGLMGAHGSQIKPQDRWMIVNYIRELAKNQ